MDDEMLNMLIKYIDMAHEGALATLRRVHVLEALLESRGLIPDAAEFEKRVEEYSASLAVDMALDPRFQEIDRLKRMIEEQEKRLRESGGKEPT